MKKLTNEAYNDIKGSLMLGSVADQIKFTKDKFTVHELRLINKSTSWEDHCKAVDEVNFKEETKAANKSKYICLSPEQLADVREKLEALEKLFL